MLFKKIATWLLIVLITTSASAQNKFQFPFQDPSLGFDERATDLINRLTLHEKISQLFNQSAAIERLQIPAYNWWNEALHGVARAGTATVFPQAIGLAATFNEELMSEVANTISDEARAKHNFFISNHINSIYTGLTFWSPNINIFRDPRWGRGQETYGEDPFLTGRMAVNFIKGLQGNDPKYLKTIATAKHYAVHSGPEFSRHSDNVFINDRDLYETYLPAFKAAVVEGHVQSVMCAYNRFRDQPCCGSNTLLSNILRSKFKFNGYVVSDCGAISDFYNTDAHHVVNTVAQAWGWSLSAGTNLNCEDAKAFIPSNIDSAIKVGIINEKDINTSLHRLFKARFMLGLFDAQKVSYNKIPMTIVGNKAHQELSLKAAQQSLVLLKNNGILPLHNVSRVALIGPNANNIQVLLGNYNGQPVNPVTPLQALQKRLGSNNVFYSAGCPIVKGVYTNFEVISGSQLFHLENSKLQNGLKAEYFSNTKFNGEAVIIKTDNTINFHWKRSPLNEKIEDQFSVRWTGILIPSETGNYIFGGNVQIKINNLIAGDAITLEAGKQYKLEATISVEPFWWGNTIEPTAVLSWVNSSLDLQSEALSAAKKSDLIIFCGGISSQLEGEEMPLQIDGFSHGDRTDLNLPEGQEALLKQLKQTGKKIIYINFSGSAVALNWENDNADAIIQAFYPGEAAGTAIVNTLFGNSNPSGRLPVTFYRSVDDLPPFKEYSMKGRTYRYFSGKPLYPFGYGMSYTSFNYKNLNIPKTLKCGDTLKVMVDVTNDGNMDGEEVVELYISHPDSLTSPLLSLAGFTHVYLKDHETKKVMIKIKPEQLSILDKNFERAVMPGDVNIFSGGKMPDRFSAADNNVLRSTLRLWGSPKLLK